VNELQPTPLEGENETPENRVVVVELIADDAVSVAVDGVRVLAVSRSDALALAAFLERIAGSPFHRTFAARRAAKESAR
jgi:hypothetical protein